MAFVRDHDLSCDGDFPVNTHGGQLGFGQPGLAGGMSQPVEAVRQIRGAAASGSCARPTPCTSPAPGGIMSEQTALILQGG